MKNKNVFAALFLSVIILIVLLWVAYKPYASGADTAIQELESGWDIQYEGITLTDVNLNECSVKDIAPDGLKEGTVLIMQTVLPEADIDNLPAVMFKSKHCAYEVYVDDNMVADFAMDEYQNGEYIGSIYHFVKLPADCAGQTLTIRLYVSLDNAFATFNPYPSLGSLTKLQKSLMHENMAAVGIAGFLIVLGLVFIALSILLWQFSKELIAQLIGAVFMIDSGVYILHFADVAFMFESSYFTTEIEFVSLYLYVPLLLLLMCNIVEPKHKKTVYGISGAISILAVALIALHFSKIAVFNVTLNFYYGLTVAGFIMLVIFVIYHLFIKKLKLVPSLQLVALFITSLFMLAQELVYIIVRSMNINNNVITRSILASGSLIFAMLNIATYIFYMTESYARQGEFISLTKLAYLDGLTGLGNRLKCEKIMEDFVEARPNDDYCIVSIDVNDLKAVNDNYGHSEGDRYLKAFANMLKRRFSTAGTCCRYGGDEFVVFFENISEERLNDLLGDLKTEIDYHNLQESQIKLSASLGYAFAHETTTRACSEVYALADKRMYENKRSYHNRQMAN